MITPWDVADSAIKIGLGALIGIGGSWLAAKQGHSLELRKEVLRRRQDALERITADFESVQKVFVDLYSSFGVFVQYAGLEQAVADIQGEKVHKILMTDVYPALETLHSIEGRLRLFDLSTCAALVAEYRGRVTDLQSLVTLEGSLPTEEALDEKAHALGAVREKVYKLLATAYCGADES